VTDLLLQQAQTSRAGAQGDDDYDVIGPDGAVIGRIFKAQRLRGHRMWTRATLAGLARKAHRSRSGVLICVAAATWSMQADKNYGSQGGAHEP
jgi:hypothetical protein